MEKFLLLIVLALATIPTADADVIVKKDGTTMQVYNIEIGIKYVTYTKTEEPDSELGRIARDECFAIKTEDGEMKTLGEAVPQVKDPAVDVPSRHKTIDAVPSPRNSELIEFFNSKYYQYPSNKHEDLKKKNYGKSLILWGYAKNSVINGNMTMQFLPKDIFAGSYFLNFSNGTDKNLYVDLSKSFYIDKSGATTPMHNGNIFTSTQGKDSSVGVNLGAVTNALGVGGAVGMLANGVNVGGGSSSSNQVTKVEQSIVIVPPGGTVFLPISRDGKGDIMPVKFDTSLFGDNVSVNKNGLIKYTDEDSPESRKFVIAYSTDSEFTTTYIAPVTLYIRAIYGFNPISTGTGINGLNRDFFDYIRQNGEVIWGVGTIEKVSENFSKAEKKALKEALKGNANR